MMGQHQPLFSIIIPTYARPVELADCLEALAHLQFPRDSFEVIVVDDGSTSPPQGVVRRFRDPLDISLVTATHAGPAAARNRGAERAAGKFFAFTDDDCRPAPDWLHALAARCAAVPDHLVGGRTVNALPANPYATTSQLILDVVYAHYNAEGAAARFFACNNLTLPADRFRTLGGFNPNFTTSEDRELCDRWLQHGYGMTYAPEALVYHAHPLNLRRFWWQHFGYGRGAWRFHDIRAQRGSGRFEPDWIFYRRLGTAPFARVRGPRMALIATLLLLSQVANGAGFFYERRQRPEAAAA
jgi:GT2 family glycosyltransferase